MALIFANKGALYASLVSWLADNSAAIETLDRAIALVEADMRRRLRIFQMEVTADLCTNGETMVVPSRFLAVRRLYIPGYRAMGYLSPELIVDHQVDNPGPGRPTKFTLEGREDILPVLRFSPTPDAEYMVRLTYLADPALTDAEDCNSILDQYPDVYHYGALSHLGDYVRNKERLPDWKNRYEEIIKSINDADLRDKVDGSTLRPRSVYS